MAKHGKKKHQKQRGPVKLAGGSGQSGAASSGTLRAEAERGLAAFERGDYPEAIRIWERVRTARPSAGLERALAEAHFRRALATTSAANRARELQQAVALAPNRAIYHLHLGLAHERQGQRERALGAYEAAQRLAPKDDRVRRQLALARLAEPVTLGAAAELLASAPKRDKTATRLRALAALRSGDPAAAITWLADVKSGGPLGNLALGLARLAAGEAEAAHEGLLKLALTRRGAAPVVDEEARRVAALGAAVAKLRGNDRTGALATLQAGSAPSDEAPRRAYARVCRSLGKELLRENSVEEAVEAWRLAAAAEPGHEPSRRALGHLLEVAGTRSAQRGDFLSAATYWEGALAGRPGDARLLRNLALVEERLQRWEQAATRWEELARGWRRELQAARRQEATAADLRRRLIVTYRHLAGTYDAADDRPGAIRTLERALNLDPSDLDLRLRLAEWHLELEELDNAIGQLRRVEVERPNDTWVLLNLGSAYDLKGNDGQALSYLERALALEPENAAVRATLGSVHHGRAHRRTDAGRLEEAVAEYERALELTPNDGTHYECLGGVQLKLGQPAAAKESFRRALDLKPLNPMTLVTIGGMYLEQGYEKEADRLFKQALQFRGRQVGEVVVAMTYLRHGYEAKAAPYLKRILKSSDPELLVLVGRALVDLKREAQALPFVERAVMVAPWYVPGHTTLAVIYLYTDNIEGALAELDAAELTARVIDDQEGLAEVAAVRAIVAEATGIESGIGRRSLRGGW